MTTPTGSGPLILSVGDPAYTYHTEEIIEIAETATRLNKLQEHFANQIIDEDGNVTCDRERGDQRYSVSKSYFGIALRCTRNQENAEVRELLYRVLAVHYGVSEIQRDASATPNHSEYVAAISDADTYCTENGLSSLLPNLFDAASLRKFVEKNGYDFEEGKDKEYLLKLAGVVACQPKHLHALTMGICFSKKEGCHALTTECIDLVAKQREVSIAELCNENMALLEVYAEACMELGDTESLKDICDECDTDAIFTQRSSTQSYLLALHKTEQLDTLEDVLTRYADAIRDQSQNRFVKEVLVKVCEAVGWNMYGKGKYDEATALLKKLVPEEIHEEGTRLQALHSALQQ